MTAQVLGANNLLLLCCDFQSIPVHHSQCAQVCCKSFETSHDLSTRDTAFIGPKSNWYRLREILSNQHPSEKDSLYNGSMLHIGIFPWLWQS